MTYKSNPLINYILDTAKSREKPKPNELHETELLRFPLKTCGEFLLNNNIDSTNITFIENRPFVK